MGKGAGSTGAAQCARAEFAGARGARPAGCHRGRTSPRGPGVVLAHGQRIDGPRPVGSLNVDARGSDKGRACRLPNRRKATLRGVLEARADGSLDLSAVADPRRRAGWRCCRLGPWTTRCSYARAGRPGAFPGFWVRQGGRRTRLTERPPSDRALPALGAVAVPTR